MNGEAPSNRSIDALFTKARAARIVAIDLGRRGKVLTEIDAGELPALRAALRIREGEQDFHCMCMGTLAVELRGRFRTLGTVTYHHGVSVRFSDWRSDAWLEDGPALALLLASRGIEDPLREIERDEVLRREGADARRVWEEAIPRALRASVAHLEVDGMGLPKRPSAHEAEDALALLRADHGDDEAVARVLFAWLAAGRGPWSGYPSYEELPMHLLRAMPFEAVLAAALGLDDRLLGAAARYFGAHELVTFQKRMLGDVPARFFDRARPIVAASGVEDDLARWDHAARVARMARDARRPRPPYHLAEGTVVGESLDGPLSCLAAIGEQLFSCDVQTIVRFDPESVVPTVIARASEHFVVLAAGTRLTFGTMNAGDVHWFDGERVLPLAKGQACPVEMAAYGNRVAWLNRDAPGGRAIVIARHGNELARATHEVVRTIERLPASTWSLGLGPEHAFWVQEAFNGSGEIRRASIEGGAIETLAQIAKLGPSMASPRLVFSEHELLVGLPDGVIAIDAGGRTRRIVEAGSPIRAIAADESHIALIVGEDGTKDPPWSFAAAPRAGGRARVLASFARAPYHRHPLVIARGHAVTTLGDRIIAAPL
jgi:hypothetical protein